MYFPAAQAAHGQVGSAPQAAVQAQKYPGGHGAEVGASVTDGSRVGAGVGSGNGTPEGPGDTDGTGDGDVGLCVSVGRGVVDGTDVGRADEVGSEVGAELGPRVMINATSGSI